MDVGCVVLFPTRTDQRSQGASLWSREGEWGIILAPVLRGGNDVGSPSATAGSSHALTQRARHHPPPADKNKNKKADGGNDVGNPSSAEENLTRFNPSRLVQGSAKVQSWGRPSRIKVQPWVPKSVEEV